MGRVPSHLVGPRSIDTVDEDLVDRLRTVDLQGGERSVVGVEDDLRLPLLREPVDVGVQPDGIGAHPGTLLEKAGDARKEPEGSDTVEHHYHRREEGADLLLALRSRPDVQELEQLLGPFLLSRPVVTNHGEWESRPV